MSQANEPRSTLLGQSEYAKLKPATGGDRKRLLERARTLCQEKRAKWYLKHVGDVPLSDCSTAFLRELVQKG